MITAKRIIDRLPGRLPIIAAGCALSLAAMAETGAGEDLEQCRALEDQAARLACYDKVAGRQSEAAPASPADPEADTVAEQALSGSDTEKAAAVEAAATPPQSDERLATLGEEQLGQKEQSEKLELSARVVRCEQDGFRRYFFYFENGQVWKQKSDRRLSYRDCDFNVTITKDFFGYKMLPEGESRRIRISRVK